MVVAAEAIPLRSPKEGAAEGSSLSPGETSTWQGNCRRGFLNLTVPAQPCAHRHVVHGAHVGRDTQGLARRGALPCQMDVAPLPVMVSCNDLPFWYLQR